VTDIVERLRLTNADFLHEEAAAEIEWLRGERQRLADELGKAHRDVLPWIDQVGYLNGEWNLLVAALKQAADGLREVGAIHAADGIDAMLKEREPWSMAVFLPATKLT
jgi:hypothetical protein